MKKLLILGNLLFIGLMLQAQTPEAFGKIKEKKVPKTVLSSYQSITNQPADQWAAFKARYQATTKKDNHIVFYRFNDQGLFKEKLVKLNWETEAPERIKAGKATTQQKYWKVKEFYEVTADGGDISYILLLKDEYGKLATVYFENDGNLNGKTTFD